MEELFLKMLEKSCIGQNKKDIAKYFNANCFFEDSNYSIKVRDIDTEELIFVVSYDNNNIVTDLQ